jgi:hypothetical protein
MVNPQFDDVENLNTKVLSRNCFQASEIPLFTPIVPPISTPIPDNGGIFLPRRTSSPCGKPGRGCLVSERSRTENPFYLWQKEFSGADPPLNKPGRQGAKAGTAFVFLCPRLPPLRRYPIQSLRDRTVYRCPRALPSLRSSRRSGATLRSSAHVLTLNG